MLYSCCRVGALIKGGSANYYQLIALNKSGGY